MPSGLGCVLLSLSAALVVADLPVLQIYNGHIPIEQPATNIPIQHFVVGQPYTFEIYMKDVQRQDYMVETCSLNGRTFIDGNGCVFCGDGILSSIETEQYARAGAIKRTLVHFIAKEEAVNIACNIRVLDCCGCAERSCERHPPLLMYPAVTHSLVYPAAAIVTEGLSFPLWLLILFLILLLLALLACCLIPILLVRRRQKATTTVAREKSRGTGVGNETAILKDTAVGCKNVYRSSIDSGTFHHITPAVAVADSEPITTTTEVFSKEERCVCVDSLEETSRTGYHGVEEKARSSQAESGFLGSKGRGISLEVETVGQGSRRKKGFSEKAAPEYTRESAIFTDRSSYRNYAYQQDHEVVAPVEGFDEVETREKIYCLNDDVNYELVEKDVERKHTTRFMQETCRINEDDTNSVGERYREEDVHHAVYTKSLPV